MQGSHNRLLDMARRRLGDLNSVGGGVPAEASSGPAYIGYYASHIDSDDPLTINPVSWEAGNLVVVAIAWSAQSPTVSSVSDGTNAFTAATNHATEDVETQFWYKVIGATITGGTLTIDFSGSISATVIIAVFSGSFAASPLDEDIRNPASLSGDNTYTVTSSAAFDQASEIVLVSVKIYDSAETVSADTTDGFIEVVNYTSSGTTQHLQYKIITETTQLTCNGSKSSTDYWSAVMTSYKTQ